MGEIKHLINITDLSVEDIDHLMETADDIIAHPENYWTSAMIKYRAISDRPYEAYIFVTEHNQDS